MLHLMELRGGSIAGHKHCTCVVASHREAAANLLVSSELLCGCNADHFVGAWSKWQALTTRVPEAETSTHLGVRVCLARWSIRKLASSAGDSSYRLRCGPQPLHLHLRLARWSSRKLALSRSFVAAPLQTTLQVRGRGGKHSPHECLRQRRTRTLRLVRLTPRTVEQPQACSIRASSRLRCRPYYRCMVTPASTLHPSAGLESKSKSPFPLSSILDRKFSDPYDSNRVEMAENKCGGGDTHRRVYGRTARWLVDKRGLWIDQESNRVP